jgi:hypothetical protein
MTATRRRELAEEEAARLAAEEEAARLPAEEEAARLAAKKRPRVCGEEEAARQAAEEEAHACRGGSGRPRRRGRSGAAAAEEEAARIAAARQEAARLAAAQAALDRCVAVAGPPSAMEPISEDAQREIFRALAQARADCTEAARDLPEAGAALFHLATIAQATGEHRQAVGSTNAPQRPGNPPR